MLTLLTVGDAAVVTPTERIDSTAGHLLLMALFLAHARGRRVPRTELGELFWPDAPADAQQHRLRQVLYRLKRAGVPVTTTGQYAAIEPELIEADYRKFHDASWVLRQEDVARRVQAILPVRSEPSPRIATWLDDFKSEIARDVARGLVAAIGVARDAGDWRAVERCAEACRVVDALNEEAHLALAEALIMTASKERALQVLDEYGVETGMRPELRVPVRLLRQRIQAMTRDTPPPAPGGDAPFVGRTEIRQRLLDAFEEARHRRGGARVIWGPAGIGKSRLLAEMAREATLRDAAVVALRCQPGDTLRPLSVLFDLVPELLKLPGSLGCSSATLEELRRFAGADAPSTDHVLSAEAASIRRGQIQAAVLDLVDALSDERPLVITVDDAQWMDPGLREFWEGILPWSRTHSLLWFFGVRANSTDDLARLATGRDAPATVLAPLDAASAGELVEHMLTDSTGPASNTVRQRITQRGGGNPLVLRELARHYLDTQSTDALPRSIADLIEDRLDRLGRPALRLVQASAILGSFATLERLGDVVDLPRVDFVDALSDLAAAGILADEPDGRVVCHALWTDAASARLQPIVAGVLHRHVATRLESELTATPTMPLLAECARHWQAAGDAPRALAAMLRSADHLAASGFLADSAAVMRRAIDVSPDAVQRIELMERRIELLYRSAQFEAVETAIDEHQALAADLDPTYETHNDLELRRRWAEVQRTGDLPSALEASLRCARAVEAPVAHRLLAAREAAKFGETVGAPAGLAEAYEIAQSLPAMTVEDRRSKRTAYALYHIGIGDPEMAAVVTREWIDDERRIGDSFSLGRALSYAGDAALFAGHIPDARAIFQEGLALCERVGFTDLAMRMLDALVALSFEFDTVDRTAAWVKRFKESLDSYAPDSMPRRMFAPMYEAQIALARGDAATALRIAPPAADCLAQGARLYSCRFLAVHLAARLDLGDDGPMPELAAAMAPSFEQPGRWLDWPAAVYARYLEREQGRDAARTFVRHFVARIRRELYPPHPDLRPFLSDD